MHTVQQKKHSQKYLNRNKIYEELIFVVEGSLEENVQKSSIFSSFVRWNSAWYIFLLKSVVFLMCLEYYMQDSRNIFKQFLFFSENNFWKNYNLNYSSLDKSALFLEL